jgi:hypothetical protein
MKLNPQKDQEMNIDQQIQAFENKIMQLEQMKKSYLLSTSGWNPQHDAQNSAGRNIHEIEKNLDDTYREITILKIRKMMGY